MDRNWAGHDSQWTGSEQFQHRGDRPRHVDCRGSDQCQQSLPGDGAGRRLAVARWWHHLVIDI